MWDQIQAHGPIVQSRMDASMAAMLKASAPCRSTWGARGKSSEALQVNQLDNLLMLGLQRLFSNYQAQQQASVIPMNIQLLTRRDNARLLPPQSQPRPFWEDSSNIFRGQASLSLCEGAPDAGKAGVAGNLAHDSHAPQAAPRTTMPEMPVLEDAPEKELAPGRKQPIADLVASFQQKAATLPPKKSAKARMPKKAGKPQPPQNKKKQEAKKKKIQPVKKRTKNEKGNAQPKLTWDSLKYDPKWKAGGRYYGCVTIYNSPATKAWRIKPEVARHHL